MDALHRRAPDLSVLRKRFSSLQQTQPMWNSETPSSRWPRPWIAQEYRGPEQEFRRASRSRPIVGYTPHEGSGEEDDEESDENSDEDGDEDSNGDSDEESDGEGTTHATDRSLGIRPGETVEDHYIQPFYSTVEDITSANPSHFVGLENRSITPRTSGSSSLRDQVSRNDEPSPIFITSTISRDLTGNQDDTLNVHLADYAIRYSQPVFVSLESLEQTSATSEPPMDPMDGIQELGSLPFSNMDTTDALEQFDFDAFLEGSDLINEDPADAYEKFAGLDGTHPPLERADQR